MLRSFALKIILVGSVPLAQGSQSESFKDAFQNGTESLKSGKLDAAAAEFAVALRPGQISHPLTQSRTREAAPGQTGRSGAAVVNQKPVVLE